MSKEHKERIQQRINAFATGNLADNAIALFKELGYESNKRITLDKGAFEGLFAELSGANKQKAFFDDWLSADYLFQLTEDEISHQKSLFSVNKYNPNEYQSYSFVVIELKNEHYARGKLSQITREVNKLFPMPVMILFKYGSLLTLSVINRRLHKRDDSKDVLEKVTLIKDIRISPAGGGVHRTEVEVKVPIKKGGEGVVSRGGGVVAGDEGTVTHRAHIEILFDLSFDELKNKHGFTNFVEMHNAWQKTLDTRELNKRFFKELANWYFWAMDNVEFPDDLEKKKDARNATNLIRLITRLVFIWFIKEKELLPDLLFNKNHLNTILNDFNKNNTSNVYYHAILQNLFFGTLNQKMGERDFAKEGSHYDRMEDYGVKNLFRYPDKFAIKEKEVIELFKDIPFLNGGLFDCLDKPDEKNVIQYVDGFSRKKSKQAKVPDFLFFSDELEVDLNEIFGTRNKKYTAKGLINLLDSYKFTVAENTPIEEEIALDPELLGKVFENLLASYNPETQTTARKQTGSFYTPREIVNYMVDESLLAYLKQSLSSCHDVSSCHSVSFCHSERSEESNDIDKNEERLRDLLSYSENPNPFDEKETWVLIEAIDNCKILDPACGSGAFPMGILHKLVHILHKLDTRNELWKQRQIDKALQIDDPNIRDHATQDIEEAFENNELDYGRKLYLIENCIYGVDIQPIAVQIAKLRFFISLIIDEKKQPGKENLGIRSLPNLETKFVAANTLIALDKPQGQLSFGNLEIERLEKELKQLRHEYFNAKTRKEKLQCQKQDKKLRQDIAGLLVNDGWNNTTARQIAAFDLYDQNASADFFDSEWMFGPDLKNGFDIVIGNPPYGGALSKTEIEYFKANYSLKSSETAILFIEKGNRILQHNGILSYIIPKSYTFASNYTAARHFTINDLAFIVDCGKAFENVLLEATVFQIIKNKSFKYYKSIQLIGVDFLVLAEIDKKLVDKYGLLPNGITDAEIAVADKLTANKYYLNDIATNRRGTILLSLLDIGKFPVIGGKEIDRLGVRNVRGYINEDLHGTASEIKANSILVQGIVAHIQNPVDHIKITACLPDDNSMFIADNINQIILSNNSGLTPACIRAILNSTLINWFVYLFIYGKGIRTLRIDNPVTSRIPIPKTNSKQLQPFEFLTNYSVLSSKHNQERNCNFFERLIDAMVYELYLEEEVKAAGCEVLKHIAKLPEFKDYLSNEKKLAVIEKVYKELSDSKHPVSVAMAKMQEIAEIKLIEGKR